MTVGNRVLGALCTLAVVLLTFVHFKTSSAQSAASSTDVVQIDLNPLIDVAAKDRNRFAVDIPHVVDASRAGSWSVARGVAIWRYSVRIPTAVSLSFHASNIVLPPSAELGVQAGGDTYVYRARDTRHRQLWSRISKGESLDLELTVAPRERRAVVLQIASFQAGYRGLGHAVADHPHYARLQARARVASTSSCIVNYECDVTAANTPAGQATVALIINNAFQCSGTLLNDVPHDGKPYVLTARHCENGKLGGGAPGAAAGVVVYWDATSPCGSPLGTLYDPGIVTQQGATTVAEQQDAWLLLLDQPPAVGDAYLAGFDATGGTVQGGYTIHHALSNDKQWTAWNGQAFTESIAGNTSLPVPYTSNFWDVINLTGTFGPGASGSALVDQNNRVVGSLSLGNQAGATGDGYVQCPVSSPPEPSSQNAVAQFTSLAAVWNSTADTTGSAATIQQVLDPNNTATLVVDAMPAPATVRFTAAPLTLSVGSTATLSWSAIGASSCTASGGNAGDGWGGALATSGNQAVSESAAGAITFAISCSYPDGHASQSQVSINWVPPDPRVNLFAPGEAWAGGAVPLTWSTNDPPCQLTVGNATQSLSGSSGTLAATQTTPGKYDYHVACGSGAQSAVEDAYITFLTPSITFYPSTTDLRVGQALELSWSSLANACTTGGGMPNDGWSGAQVGGGGFISIFPANLGTYTYTLRCVQGQASAQAAVTVTLENNPPYATLTVSSNTIAMGQSVTASYKSNIAGCVFGQSAVGTQPPGIVQVSSTGGDSEGTRTFTGGQVGASTLTFDCGSVAGAPTVVSATPQTVTVEQAVSASVTAPANAVTGTPFTLSWQTGSATSCSASGGGADGTPWTGAVALPSGQQSITPTATGQFTYTLTCVGQVPGDTTSSQATVNVTAAASAPTSGSTSSSGGSSGSGAGSSSTGSHGGGGAFDGLTLGLLSLATLKGLGRSRRRAKRRAKSSCEAGADRAQRMKIGSALEHFGRERGGLDLPDARDRSLLEPADFA
jgi:hypothetical protein